MWYFWILSILLIILIRLNTFDIFEYLRLFWVLLNNFDTSILLNTFDTWITHGGIDSRCRWKYQYFEWVSILCSALATTYAYSLKRQIVSSKVRFIESEWNPGLEPKYFFKSLTKRSRVNTIAIGHSVCFSLIPSLTWRGAQNLLLF